MTMGAAGAGLNDHVLTRCLLLKGVGGNTGVVLEHVLALAPLQLGAIPEPPQPGSELAPAGTVPGYAEG